MPFPFGDEHREERREVAARDLVTHREVFLKFMGGLATLDYGNARGTNHFPARGRVVYNPCLYYQCHAGGQPTFEKQWVLGLHMYNCLARAIKILGMVMSNCPVIPLPRCLGTLP